MYYRVYSKVILLIFFLLLLCLAISFAASSDYYFVWGPPTTGGAVEHYVLSLGRVSGTYVWELETTETTMYFSQFETLPDFAWVEGGEYHAIVQACNAAGEGERSNEVSYTVPLARPGKPALRKK